MGVTTSVISDTLPLSWRVYLERVKKPYHPEEKYLTVFDKPLGARSDFLSERGWKGTTFRQLRKKDE